MRKPSILVVEDDTDIQQLVSYNLIKSGFNVTCADSGEEALNLLGRERVDAMVLDLMLPDMPGIEVLRALRADPVTADVPVVVISATGAPA